MLERIAGNISRYNMFTPGCRVGVAVSGGADSVCLLHALFELAPRWNLHLSVVHVDHGIRGEASREDAGFVHDLATRLGLPFHCREAGAPEIAERTGDNLEQAARRIRYGFFRELLTNGVLDRVATGHTRSDQAETVLYRAIRGTGFTGLAGIRATTTDGIVRPLLPFWRSDVEAWLRERQIGWREDDTNADHSFMRNRIRHELLPLLRAEFNPQVDDALARLAEMAAEDEEYWAVQPPRVALVNGAVTLDVRSLSSLPAAAARRVIRRAIELVRGDLRQIDYRHVDRILELAGSTEGSGRMMASGLDVFRSFDWMRLSDAGAARPARDYSLPVLPPCMVRLPGGGAISFEIREKPNFGAQCDKLEDSLNWPEVSALPELRGGALELRNWRPGDRYRPAGQDREQKIKQMFQEARIPLWERRHWPVLAAGARVLWTRRFGVADGLKQEAQSGFALCIREDA